MASWEPVPSESLKHQPAATDPQPAPRINTSGPLEAAGAAFKSQGWDKSFCCLCCARCQLCWVQRGSWHMQVMPALCQPPLLPVMGTPESPTECWLLWLWC